MKFTYKFSNLLGTVYRKGNLTFTPDGNSVISPVGNRLTVYDLKNGKSSTLAAESRFNIVTCDISPNGSTLIAVNEQGDGYLISLISNTVIYRHRFLKFVPFIKFSPDGRYFAVCKGHSAAVFLAPGEFMGEYNPFRLERVFYGPYDDTVCLDWTSDSRVLAVGSKDTSVKIYGIHKLKRFRICSLGGHADVIVGVFFEENSLDVISVSRNGRVCIWEANLDLSDIVEDTGEPPANKARKVQDEDDDIDLSRGERRDETIEEEVDEEPQSESTDKLKYKLLAKHFINTGHEHKITSVSYHKKRKIMVVGRNDGSFDLFEMPDVNKIQSLSISDASIGTIAINSTGDWLALGCEALGQLLVWEWQSETYVLKQVSHSAAMSCLAYSGDSQYIVTGGEDGKLKLWDTLSGFCIVTFTEHTSQITQVRFANNRKFFISASLDGTVRAYDMARYRNFRTLVSNRPVQFASLAIDSSCEFVAAGGQDVFEIYIWSMKIGKLLEILAGHEGPVAGLAFHPGLTSTELASVSWDRTVRIWNAVESPNQFEAIRLPGDALSVAYRPDGNEIVVATLDGQLSFFEPKTGLQKGCIEGQKDLNVGRADEDKITPQKKQEGRAFTCLCYSPDGTYILAAGQSKYVCIYNRDEKILLKKYEITQNRSFDAVDEFINRRKMGDFGNVNLVEMREEGKASVTLPGAKKGDMAARIFKPEIRVYNLQFSPTGLAWAAVTTEGLLIYSLDFDHVFDPFMLEESITPDAVKKAKEDEKYSEALMMALKLNDRSLIREVVEAVPTQSIDLCTCNFPQLYTEKILIFLADTLESTKHFEFYVKWVKSLLSKCKKIPGFVEKNPAFQNTLVTLEKNLKRRYMDLSKVTHHNKYMIEFLKRLSIVSQKKNSGSPLKTGAGQGADDILDIMCLDEE